MRERWIGRPRRAIALHWREDCRRGVALGVAVSGPVLAWLGLG